MVEVRESDLLNVQFTVEIPIEHSELLKQCEILVFEDIDSHLVKVKVTKVEITNENSFMIEICVTNFIEAVMFEREFQFHFQIKENNHNHRLQAIFKLNGEDFSNL